MRQEPRSPQTPGVVVTGMGMTTPLGGNVVSSWEALLNGESHTSVINDDWAAGLPIKIAARLREEPDAVLPPVQIRRLDRSQQIVIVAAREAWTAAQTPDVDPERFAVVIGTGVGGAQTFASQDEVIRSRGPLHVSPFAIPMLMPNGAAAAVGLCFGARGGVHTPISACASGAEAIAVGLALVRSGRADVVLAGGTEACVGPLAMAGFARMGALSKRIDDPEGASRPFAADRDGFVLGEGAGVVVLEREEHAQARGARIYGRLAGAGITSNGRDMTSPDRQGQARAISDALIDARLSASDITHVNAHATGTPIGDCAEADAILDAIGEHPLVTANKASTGHLIGGTGAVEAIITMMTIREGLIPPTRNLDVQDPNVRVNIVTKSPYQTDITAAVSNSFGFGGHNVALVFIRDS